MQKEPIELDRETLWYAQHLGRETRQLLYGVLEADTDGDPERSFRLLGVAEERLALAFEVGGEHVETLEFLSSVGRHLKRLKDHLAADVRALAGYTYKNGGSFAKSKEVQPHPRMRIGRVDWRFDFNGKVKCDCACFVSVFHFEDPETGNLLTPQSAGFIDGFDPPGYGLPHDGHQVYGYSVDAGSKKAPAKRLVPPWPARKCPCDLTGKRLKGPDRLEGHDQPTAVRRGVVAIYETAVVCLKKRPFEILGSMVWKAFEGKVEILKKGGGVDRGDASLPYKRALNDWIEKFGNDCCK